MENLLMILTWQDKTKAAALTIALGAILVVWALNFLGLLMPAAEAIIAWIFTMISMMWSKLPAHLRENPFVAKVVLHFSGEQYLLEAVEKSVSVIIVELASILMLLGGVFALTSKTMFPDMVTRTINGGLAYTAGRPGWDKRVNYSPEDAAAGSLAAFDPHCNPIVYLLEKGGAEGKA